VTTEARENRTAWVLAGGGSLGAVEVGMMRALVASGQRPDFLVGASVGAINAVYFAGDPTLDGLDRLVKVWTGLRRSDVFPLSPVSGMLAMLGRRPNLLRSNALQRLLSRELPLTRLEESVIPCSVVATDVLGGGEVRLDRGDAVQALLASTAIPGFFPPVEIDGRLLMDGGVANNTPISTAVGLGLQRVIVLPTGVACVQRTAPQSAMAMVLHAFSYLISRHLVRDIERFADIVEVVVVPPLCPLVVSPYDFSQPASLIARASELTEHWIQGGGMSQPDVPMALTPHSH